jgi:hypothetical protein
LATAFETDEPEAATDAGFGPDVDHEPRMQAFAAAMRVGRLIPLRELVTVTSLPRDSINMHDFYNQSYALTTWLCRERPQAVLAYLRLLNSGDARRRSANQHMEMFERAFGEIDRLHDAWLPQRLATKWSGRRPDGSLRFPLSMHCPGDHTRVNFRYRIRCG